MARKSKITGDVPLRFAKSLSGIVKREWEKGTFLERVSPVTRDLINHWFDDAFCDIRNINFHEGQRQAILNAIYLHEVLQINGVKEMYMAINPEFLMEMDLAELETDKYKHPKYAIKMATGTGKTWVLNALLIWQYLNSKYENEPSGRFTKNFLIVAPGLIVYERLLDAFLGKENENGTRDFQKSDFKKFEELFIPGAYKDEIFGFIQSNVAKKDEIGNKVTGEGLIAITNWHLLVGNEENKNIDSPLEEPDLVVKDVFPITPGKAQGNDLRVLDNQYLKGNELKYLSNLPDLLVFNDEAHHIHSTKKGGEIFEVEWQKSLNLISKPKKDRFIQIDFSATPYAQLGSGKTTRKHFFPHIIVDFELKTAIRHGLVKIVALDRRNDIASIDLDYKAERNGKGVVGLSGGQKTMLRAGLQKLRILEEDFVALTADKQGISKKHPKMLVICEDTAVSPYVVDFLKGEGLSDDDFMEIHSTKKGDLKKGEWEKVRQRLFNIDQHESPKVIISVLMLREGFDVNNICIIVPLRAASSNILLEQTIGRGLRLMWREREYEEIKNENRILLLDKKEEPSNYMDILSIVEHPNFIKFYDEMIEGGAAGIVKEPGTGRVLGDVIKVGLRDDYQKYDFFWPIIIQEREETLSPAELNINKLEPFDGSLEELKKIVPKDGDEFYSQELTVKTRFGKYSVKGDIFTANSYNEFIAKLIGGVTAQIMPTGKRKKSKKFPMMQINTAMLAQLADDYIRKRLFNQDFDPFENNNWRVLLLYKSGIVQHIVKNIGASIYEMQNNVEVREAIILKQNFSEVEELKIREKYSLDISKTIYEKLGYPSNKGGFEKNFIEFVDKDAEVQSFLKINQYYHDFAYITYLREDGLLAHYFPDFIVKIGNQIYIVETKADKDVKNPNVEQKKNATIDWLNKINELRPEDRMFAMWNYVLLGENTFYQMSESGADTQDILEYRKSTTKVDENLDEYFL